MNEIAEFSPRKKISKKKFDSFNQNRWKEAVNSRFVKVKLSCYRPLVIIYIRIRNIQRFILKLFLSDLSALSHWKWCHYCLLRHDGQDEFSFSNGLRVVLLNNLFLFFLFIFVFLLSLSLYLPPLPPFLLLSLSYVTSFLCVQFMDLGFIKFHELFM